MDTPKAKPKWSYAPLWLLLAVFLVFGGLFLSRERTPDLGWSTDLAASQERAAAEGKPLLLLFSAEWCDPCQRMKRVTWPDPVVKAIVNSRVVPVYLDIDRKELAGIVEQYGVDPIPHVLLANAKGKPLTRAGQPLSAIGFLSAQEMTAFLSKALDPGHD
jgi:thioredoxin-related protein